ncbi:flagellar hook protein FlgE [uncultured Brevundimonas sp.]|uniref:flagellar hook protein FlgE n=1 Tax=uncultured Brevundimonas sp. TaxID=213418 RepID=UPI0030ED34D8|tara:strand:+ start:4154 stop:4363 length:210 start_codon:yes stop_codon:yes gene_type:complete
MQAFAIAAGGIATATARFDASARRTAAGPLDTLAEEMVDRLQSEVALKANVAVLKTADRMTGTLLDMLA